MNNNNQYANDILEKCTECGRCADSCCFLTDAGESPRAITARGASIHDAFSCSLCGACQIICPQGLSPWKMFAARRREAVDNSEFDISRYRYLFPDRNSNIMSAFRKYAGIDYSDISNFGDSGICFFPGCTLMTYSSGLTRGVWTQLKENSGCDSMLTACCGRLLEQMGMQQRAEDMRDRLQEYVQSHNIHCIITVCPGCYYELKNIFQSTKVMIQTVYEVLHFKKNIHMAGRRCAVHDSCPDRFDGTFGNQVRQALKTSGVSIVEMLHHKTNTICCGSGGQLSHFRPDLVEALVQMRQDEARMAGAEIMVGYCLSCVLKYGSNVPEIPVMHVLNVLLEIEEDFKGAKERAAQMLSGSDGEKIWQEIMSD